jgi:hypothetical protein
MVAVDPDEDLNDFSVSSGSESECFVSALKVVVWPILTLMMSLLLGLLLAASDV